LLFDLVFKSLYMRLLGFLAYSENIEYFVLPICIHKKKTFGPLSSIVASGIITPIIVGKIGKAKTKQGTRECALLAGHLRVAVGKAAPSTVMDTSKNRTASVNSFLRTSSSGQDIAEITIYGLLATMD